MRMHDDKVSIQQMLEYAWGKTQKCTTRIPKQAINLCYNVDM